MSRANLEKAIREGDARQVASLLAAQPGLANGPLEGGLWPLHLAARHDHPEVVAALLDAGADLEAVDDDGETALCIAASHGGSPEVVRLLLANGASVDHANGDGARPINLAALDEEDAGVESTTLLVKHGANLRSMNGASTPLLSACLGGRLETVTRLVEAGADVNELTGGRTALHIAIGRDNEKIVEYLLANGADCTIQDPVQSPPLDALGLAERLKAKRCLRVLRRHLGLDGGPSVPAQLAWEQFVARLPDRGRAYGLRKPAPPEAVTNLEEAIGGMLPEEFRDYLFTNNGQKEAAEPLVPPWLEFDVAYRLLGAREILGQWKMMHRVKAGGDFDDGRPSPDKGIQSTWWDEGWVPFADNESGDYICLDLHPTKQGKRGQIIHFSHESGRRLLLTQSFNAWLAAVAQSLAG